MHVGRDLGKASSGVGLLTLLISAQSSVSTQAENMLLRMYSYICFLNVTQRPMAKGLVPSPWYYWDLMEPIGGWNFE